MRARPRLLKPPVRKRGNASFRKLFLFTEGEALQSAVGVAVSPSANGQPGALAVRELDVSGLAGLAKRDTNMAVNQAAFRPTSAAALGRATRVVFAASPRIGPTLTPSGIDLKESRS